MRLSKRLQDCVAFARFCTRAKLLPMEAAELIAFARRAFAAGERAANTGDHEAERRAGERLEKAAAGHGLGVRWPGLWPVLTCDGEDIELPDIG
jgi:hypothetical protein